MSSPLQRRSSSPDPYTPLPHDFTRPTQPLRVQRRSRPRANTVQLVSASTPGALTSATYHDTEERRRSDPSDLIDAARTRDAKYVTAPSDQGRRSMRSTTGARPASFSLSSIQRPPLVDHSVSYIRRPRFQAEDENWSGERDRVRMSDGGWERTYDGGMSPYTRSGATIDRGNGGRDKRGSTISKYGNPNGSNIPLELPQYNPSRPDVQNGASASGSSNTERQDQTTIPNRTFTQKAKDLFHRLTAEPELPSPPPSLPLSRSSSLSDAPSRSLSVSSGTNLGAGKDLGAGVDERGRMRGRGRTNTYAGGGRAGDDGVDLSAHPDPYANDMLLRSIWMNGERQRAAETIWDEVDGAGNIDGHGHGHGHEHGLIETVAHASSALRHRLPAQGRKEQGESDSRHPSRNASREASEIDSDGDTIVDSAPSSPGSDGKRQSSYRQRRKRRRHRIIYNRDTVDAQQGFILTLSKALLVFGSLSHRIEPQLASLAAVFELAVQFDHVPGCIQISFGVTDPTRHKQSTTLFIKATSALDLGRIHETHKVYRRVVRDEISATEGRKKLEELLAREPLYGKRAMLVLTLVQGFILCGTSFGGSLNDMWVAGILATLVAFAQQRVARSELSSSGADIFIAAIVSFTARALSLGVPNRIFCYQSISSASVTGMLPGSLMLAGVLDIASLNVQLGAPKLVSGLLTSLYLGFGLTLGSDIWLRIDAHGRAFLASIVGRQITLIGSFLGTNATSPEAQTLANLKGVFRFTSQSGGYEKQHTIAGCFRDPERYGAWKWALTPLPWYTLFVLLPLLNLVLSLKRNQPWKTREMPVMILISCISNAVTRVVNRRFGLSGHPDYAALVGSFIVSLLGNMWSRKFGGTAFTVMLTGIWLLIPTGLSEAGGLAATYHRPGEDEYTTSLSLARKMISVIIGVMSGVYLSARIVYTFGRKKNSALMTF